MVDSCDQSCDEQYPPCLVTGVREVVVCKDAKGKVGVSLFAESKGIFVCYVKSGSPGALSGLRFGDQILQVRNPNFLRKGATVYVLGCWIAYCTCCLFHVVFKFLIHVYNLQLYV